MSRASAVTDNSPPADLEALRNEFYPEVETVETWAANRLPVEHDPSWYGIGVPEFTEEARRAGWVNEEPTLAVPTGQPDYVPEPAETVTDEDVERIEEFIAAAIDMRYALLLRTGR